MSILQRERRSVKSSPSPEALRTLSQPAWERAARILLANLRYSALDADAACRWFSFRSTFKACPVLSPRDAALLDGAAAKALTEELEAQADEQVNGETESDPISWPQWTDAFRFEPTKEDRIWHCQDGERRAPTPTRRRTIHPANRLTFDAAESRAIDAHERGLIAPDVAEAIMSDWRGGHPA